MLATKQSNAISDSVDQGAVVASAADEVRFLRGRDGVHSLRPSILFDLGEMVDLRPGQILHDVGHPISSTYFLFGGLVSITVPDGRSAPVEVLTLGAGDITSLPYALSEGKSPHRATVQVSGKAFRVPSRQLREVLSSQAAMRDEIIEAINFQCLYSSYLTACNARHVIGQRVSRWLLTASDQIGRPALPVTHNVIAQAIGVRRAGITNELKNLQDKDIIDARRGFLTIKDREGLEQCACGCYAAVRAARARRPACALV
ncbi:MAG: Crp/Fnr family transcriptional regulator [Cytophagaceae bacterium]|nr:MAG: Crp/Fnr family transcriptional regulator [Cytophagaceae bacterium]